MIDFDYTLLIQFANLLILLILLNFLLFKPVLNAINRREEKIGSLFERAETLRREAYDLERTYEELAREKKRPYIIQKEGVIAEAQSSSTGLIEKMRIEAINEIDMIKESIERDSKGVYEALRKDVDRLALEIVQKIKTGDRT